MNCTEIAEHLKPQYGDAIVAVNAEAIDPWIEVAADSWGDIAATLHSDAALAMDYLHCITGVDYLETDEKKAAKVDWSPHVQVVYHLSSFKRKHRLVVKVMLPRWDEQAEDNLPAVASVAHLWKTANWHEREVYDLMGVRFHDHPNLTRILCPEDWVGHPLRKDYQMPLEYHGIRGR